MAYNQFQDYFGLSNIAWQIQDLDNLVKKDSMDNYSNELCINLSDELNSFDPLVSIRSDAHEDFLNNGVEVGLDEFDLYQAQLRERNAADLMVIDNPVLNEYLEIKRLKNKKTGKKFCVFCKNNGERTDIYMSHVLKDSEGRVMCPVLRKYTCPLCGVSGDNAHTIRYCPRNEGGFSSVSLLKTPRVATGKKRKSISRV